MLIDAGGDALLSGQTEVTTLEFSNWIHWDNRDELDEIQFPGIYLLAHFDCVPAGPTYPKDKNIIYNGETCNTLKNRWRQFHRSAFEDKQGHSGGITYREHQRSKGKILYVAAFPVSEIVYASLFPENDIEKTRHLFIRFIERKLLWEYALEHGEAPECNRK